MANKNQKRHLRGAPASKGGEFARDPREDADRKPLSAKSPLSEPDLSEGAKGFMSDIEKSYDCKVAEGQPGEHILQGANGNKLIVEEVWDIDEEWGDYTLGCYQMTSSVDGQTQPFAPSDNDETAEYIRDWCASNLDERESEGDSYEEYLELTRDAEFADFMGDPEEASKIARRAEEMGKRLKLHDPSQTPPLTEDEKRRQLEADVNRLTSKSAESTYDFFIASIHQSEEAKDRAFEHSEKVDAELDEAKARLEEHNTDAEALKRNKSRWLEGEED